MLKILTVAYLYVTVAIVEQVSSISETCIGEFCFSTPGSNGARTFDDANSWCTALGSTLTVVIDSRTQLTLAQFMNSSNIQAMAYVNAKLYQHDNAWFLLNGTAYQGNVGNQKIGGNYKLFCHLKPTERAEFLVEASKPSDLRNYVCNFEGTKCLSNSTSNILFMGICYVKYENENLTWYQARERCINYGGDLAQFQRGSNLWIAPFNTSWLNQSLTYWIGIRRNGWSWKYPDGNEFIYTSWSNGKPNNVNFSCVCVDPNGMPAWSWTDCDCSAQRPFACLKIVPTTTVTTTTSTSTTSPTIPTTATALKTIQALSSKSDGLVVGLVLGLVVGLILPLTILSVILIVWIVRLRRRLRENDRNDERTTTTAKTVERNAARTNASDPDINYQHLKRETMFGPGNSMPVYDQLSQPRNRDYENT